MSRYTGGSVLPSVGKQIISDSNYGTETVFPHPDDPNQFITGGTLSMNAYNFYVFGMKKGNDFYNSTNSNVIPPEPAPNAPYLVWFGWYDAQKAQGVRITLKDLAKKLGKSEKYLRKLRCKMGVTKK